MTDPTRRTDSASASADDFAKQATAAADQAAETIAERAQDAAAKAKDLAEEGSSFLRRKYRENPVLVIAVGLGALTALCLLVKAMARR
jgi:hypothetical protein